MATRPSRLVSPVTVPNLPAAWGEDVKEFSGHDLTEKKELVGTPLLIVGAEIERNEVRGYDNVYVYAMHIDGTEFEFKDTSTTGVAGQVRAILVEQNLNPAPGAGFQALSPKIACMKGLRISEWEFEDESTGKTKDANVFYLTGRRRPNEK